MKTIDVAALEAVLRPALRRRAADAGDEDLFFSQVLEAATSTRQRRSWWLAPRLARVDASKVLMAAAAVVAVAFAGIILLPSLGAIGGPTASPAPSDAVVPTPTPLADRVISPASRAIEPGRYSIPWGNLRPYLTIPAGWSSTGSGSIVRARDGRPPHNDPILTVHGVGLFVPTDVCASKRTLVEAGGMEGFTSALGGQTGVEVSGPTDMALGGYPAKRYVLTMPSSCIPVEGVMVFLDDEAGAFSLLEGGTATIYVVDVGTGDGMVITTHQRGATPTEIRELESIVASIEIH